MSASDSHPLLSVALLARDGAARDRLRDALGHAGARLVFEGDPNTLEPQALRDADPGAVLIALEPAIEDALERLDPVLASPSLTLIFDEADLAARRDGWEAQRWARHLAAKLHGHQDVLPPGSEQDHLLQPEPGLPTTPAQLHADAPLSFHVREAFDAATEVPADGLYQAPSGIREPMSLEEALAGLQAPPETVPAPVNAAPPVAPPPLPVASFGDHSSWSLVDDHGTPAAASVAAAVPPPAFDSERLSLVALEADVDPGSAAPGAVLVLAGIGGPDALRRLLAGLPATLAVPVLVHMRLDGGRYGNLVKQMARVSALPVVLAEAAQPVEAGQVYILSDDIGVTVHNRGLHFVADAHGVQVGALPPAHSAVVLLSGADASQVDDVLALAVAGAWVAGQVGEGCYDPTAANAVVAAGMEAGEPQQLAQVIADRWGGDT
ncbi:chemotaxis protein CheB [Stenotrophomonas sp. Marseille-Q5258]|uniref:chemotaxis protein CheB n=1 Tax=Stenotrophomonas sp. Marseille-Q5258 TaxID=2972779 RepID=UPI0021C756BA|nr:chemotaxis protein CheB [Stenotrophomonas sp. Marseille-Q5258]